MLKQRLQTYGRLMRIDRPIGTWLVAWPMLWSLWLASGGHPDASLVLIFLAGAFVMRSAGCVINDFADRKLDPHVERTRARPMAAGEVSAREALALFAVLCLTAFGLVLCTNRLTVELSFAGVALAAVYPFMKRYTHWPQVFLGAAFGWAVPMAFAAQTNAVPPEAWMVFAADICWVMAYDTMYAMVDRDDDLKIGVKSTAILFGHWDRLVIGLFQVAFIALLVAVGRHYALGAAYYAGLGVATGLAVYHQRLIFRRRREDCFRAFLNNNLLGAAVFAGLVIDLIL